MGSNKKNMMMISTAILLMIMAVIGATYAYFTATISDGDKGSSIIIKTGTLRLVYSDTEYINVSGVLPGDSYSKVVTVTNEGNVSVNYDLIWIELLNELVTKNDLTVEISCSSNTDTCGGLSNTVVSESGSNIPILTNIEIGMLETHTYTILIHFNETGSNQNDNQGKIVSGKIGIVESNPDYINLYGYIYDENGDPMSSTMVEIHSDPTSVLTDANGRYEFASVPLGNHTAYIKTSDGSSTISTTSISLAYGDSTSVSSGNVTINQTRESIGININVHPVTPIISLTQPTGVLKARATGSFYSYSTSITSITFDNKISVPGDATANWDVSSNTNGSVRAYIKPDGVSGYQLHIQGNGGVFAPVLSYNLFGNFTKVTTINGLENLNTSKVTSMQSMFTSMRKLIALDLSNFDTSKVTNMSYMFSQCLVLSSLDISNFNTSNVTDMSGMLNTVGLTSIDVSSFNTSKVTNMSSMFSYSYMVPSKITSLDLSNFDTSNVLYMNALFSGLSALTSLNISSFNTAKVTEMSAMFYDCRGLTSLNVSNFNTSNVLYMSSMFSGCSNITSLSLSNFVTTKVIEMSEMFYGMSKLTSLNLSNFNTANVTSMARMFGYTREITNLNLSNFNTAKVTNFGGMFSYMYKLETLNITSFNTSSAEYMDSFFQECKKITSLDLTHFDTSNVINMMMMFGGCNSLVSLNISNWNTAKVTDMSAMFENCNVLSSLNLSSFNTSAVTSMEMMFYVCRSLVTLNLSNFNTSNVRNMSYMFSNMDSLTSLQISNFTGSSLEAMTGMFDSTSSLTQINLSNLSTAGVTDMTNVFMYCGSLNTLYLNNADFSSVSTYDSMFYSIPENISITVKDSDAATFISSRLSDIGLTGNVTIA